MLSSMYVDHFGLETPPFSIAPDPRYLFMSERHREALAHLIYGVGAGGGFVVLSGEIGAGKTTVCRSFLEQVPEHCRVAYIFNPKLTVAELLESILGEFGVPIADAQAGPPGVKRCVDALNAYLLHSHAAGESNVLIIDEAQSLSADVLEQLRLLTNLETNERKLLQIVLIGQPELREMLAAPGLEQLSQRVIARYHLDALGAQETVQYVRHRLAVAGLKGPMPFDQKALRRIHQLARGVPRRINLLCDRALLAAYVAGEASVSQGAIEQAAREVLEPPTQQRKPRHLQRLVALAGAAALGAMFVIFQRPATGPSAGPPVTQATAAAPGPGSSSSRQETSSAITGVPNAPGALPAQAGRDQQAGQTASGSRQVAAQSDPIPEYDLPNGFSSLLGTESENWQALARRWGETLPPGDPCTASIAVGLRCFRSTNATFGLIRQLDRPGILTLRDAAGRSVPLLLLELTQQQATVAIAGIRYRVGLLALADFWRGDFATLWRAPTSFIAGSDTQLSTAQADWLAAALARAAGRPPPANTPDPNRLGAQVHTFQIASGLPSDGVAGPMTLMRLNRAIGVDEPSLTADTPGG